MKMELVYSAERVQNNPSALLLSSLRTAFKVYSVLKKERKKKKEK